jgi:hypothetical protein
MHSNKFWRITMLLSVACLIAVWDGATNCNKARGEDSRVWQCAGVATVYRVSEERTTDYGTETLTRYLLRWGRSTTYSELSGYKTTRHFTNVPAKPPAAKSAK